MVPGSTLRYGSHFWRVTLSPRLSRRQPIEAAAKPLPREDTTPPVTKMYFGAARKRSNSSAGFGVLNIMFRNAARVKSRPKNFLGMRGENFQNERRKISGRFLRTR